MIRAAMSLCSLTTQHPGWCRVQTWLTWKHQANVLAGVVALSIARVQQYTPSAIAQDTCDQQA